MTRLPASKLKELGHKPSKYRNTKTLLDGHLFDSKREAEVYAELKLLQKHGDVKDIELQPEFELLPSFRAGKASYRGIKYRADFRVTYHDGRQEVWDVKSRITAKNPEYRMKVKLLLYKYPTLNFREVF